VNDILLSLMGVSALFAAFGLFAGRKPA